MNFSDLIAAASNGSATPAKKEKAEYLLLIGMDMPNEETGEVDFVTLPQPMGLDTMRKSNVYGEGDFQEKLCKGDDLLESLLEYAQNTLQPGESQQILELKVRIYRKNKNQRDSHKKIKFSFSVE